MSSRRGGGKPFSTSSNNELSGKGKNVPVTSRSEVEQLSHGVADVALDSPQDDGWEVISRKSKNRAGSSSAKQWVSQSSNIKGRGSQGMRNNGNGGAGRGSGNSWPAQAADSMRPAGRGSSRPQSFSRGSESNYVAPPPVFRPPLENGWNWQSRPGSMPLAKGTGDGQKKDEITPDFHPADEVETNNCDDEHDDDELDALDDTDDELLSDEFDSDASEKSHGTRKMSKWFKKFFEIMDNLPVNDINDPVRQWHCPACQGGPGAIDWYKGLQPLMTHAKTKGSRRARLHREFAEILEKELQMRGTSLVPAGEVFGKWKGIKGEENKDHEIVWPPMVVIMNTKLEQDENEKWIGMGNQELLDYFNPYAAVKARHSYGPQGHRGMSLLIFETSARGYLEAERLHKHFAEQRTDRDAWNRCGRAFCPGGNRQLYGFMALREDLDIFNQHSQGKTKLKFEMRSYQEMVVSQIWQMSEDNQQLNYFKSKAAKERRNAESLQQTVSTISEKLCRTVEENRIVRQRTKMQHEENQEEMYSQEQFFKDQIKIIHESRDAKEEHFERVQQMERDKMQQLNENPSNTEEYRRRAEEIAKFIKFQDKEMDEFVAEREILIKAHEDNMVETRKRQFDAEMELKRKHFEETLELEKEFDANLTRLMEKYSPQHLQ